MARLPIGQRIRDIRTERGLSQTALAAEVGISSSYLNLIEHDKRSIGGALLNRIARRLDIDLERLSGAEDARLAQDIAELARSLSMSALDEAGAARFVARSPEWATAFRGLYRRYQDATVVASALSDRLSQDPQLMDLSHAVLTQITSIRSFAEILTDHRDLDAETRERFSGNIAIEADRLGSSVRTMIALLDGGFETDLPASSINELDDFIRFHDNYFPDLEADADQLRAILAPGARPISVAVAERLADTHAVTTRLRQDAESAEAGACVIVEPWMSEPTRRFLQARRLIEIELAGSIDALLRDERLTSAEAVALGRRALANYGAGALLFPYAPFLEAAVAYRYDVDRLALAFGGSFEQIAHRLVTLRRPGASGIPFAFLRADPAGNISKPFSLPGLRMPRLGGACPLWAIYGAFAAPERTIAQIAVMPQGERYLFVARRLAKQQGAYGATPAVFSVMLACDAAYRDRLVYGDAFAADGDSLATAVGFNCRSCPRAECRQRAHPAVVATANQGLVSRVGI